MSGQGTGPGGPNSTNPLASAIDSVVALGFAAVSASAPGAAYVWSPGGTFPTVPAGQYGSVLITGTVSGTAVLPTPYNVVLDDSTTPVTVVANGTSPQAASVTGIQQVYAARGGDGYFISGNFSAQGTASTGTGGGSGGGNLWAIGAVSASSFLASDSRADSIVASQGTNWIATGINSSDQIWIDSGSAVIASRGADTIAVGPAQASIVGSGTALMFVASGKAIVSDIAGSNTLVGSTAAVTVAGTNSASVVAFGASTGGNMMLGDGAAATLVGGGSGDMLAGLAGQNVLVAGSGNESLFSGSAARNTVFIGGSGTDVMAAQTGGNLFIAGTGTDQVLASGTANMFEFNMGKAGGTMIVQGFDGTDMINLIGYAPDAATTAFAGAQIAGGNTTLTLADNTKIMLLGFTGLTQSNVA